MYPTVGFSHSRTSLAVLLLLVGIVLLGGTLQAQSGPTSAQAQMIKDNTKVIYFPFNIYNKTVNPDVLNADAEYLKQNPDAHFWIQAYADIRGDIVYNLVLSYHRAQYVKHYLMQKGVNESQIGFATGWGKLYQICEQKDEKCYQENRRADVIPPGLLPAI